MSAPAEAVRQHGLPVLVVEDDAELRDMMTEVLGLEGFGVATARNGREALAYLRSHEPPRLILLDLMMPLMDGWQFRREQMKDPELAGVPVVVVTALDEKRNTDLRANSFLTKPLDFERLLDLVRSYCGPSELPRES